MKHMKLNVEPGQINIVVASLSIMFIFNALQYVFYNGDIHGRYHFPYSTIEHLAFFISTIALFNLISTRLSQKLIVTGSVIIVLGMGVHIARYANMVMHTSVGYVERTNKWEKLMDRAEDATEKDNKRSIILVSHHPMEIEPLISTSQFLRYRGISNPISIKTVGYDSADFPNGSLQRFYAKRLLLTQNSNGDEFPGVHFIPLNKADRSNCIEIVFGSDEIHGECPTSLNMRNPSR